MGQLWPPISVGDTRKLACPMLPWIYDHKVLAPEESQQKSKGPHSKWRQHHQNQKSTCFLDCLLRRWHQPNRHHCPGPHPHTEGSPQAGPLYWSPKESSELAFCSFCDSGLLTSLDLYAQIHDCEGRKGGGRNCSENNFIYVWKIILRLLQPEVSKTKSPGSFSNRTGYCGSWAGLPVNTLFHTLKSSSPGCRPACRWLSRHTVIQSFSP